MIILDNHMHIRPSGLGVEAIKRFEKHGGTHVIISHMPYEDVAINCGDDYRRQYKITLKMVRLVNEKTSVRAYATLGPYPGDLPKLVARFGLSDAEEIFRRGYEISFEAYDEGLCIAIGEVGRPHFPVSDEVMSLANKLLQYCFEEAKSRDAPVVLHTESGDHVYHDIAEMIKRIGATTTKVVRHFATPTKNTYGITPSILSKRSFLEEAVRMGIDFLMETDYIDDPKRPGAVLGPATVPKRVKYMLSRGIVDEDFIQRVHHDLPTKIYGNYFEL